MTTDHRVLINTLEIPIRWVDMDAYGHVNNARYFDYMSEARTFLLTKIPPEQVTCHFFLANTTCNFKRPFTFPDTVVIEQYREEVGNSSLTFFYQMFSKKNPGILYADGVAKIVSFDPKKQVVIPMPEVFKIYPQNAF